MSSRIGYQPVVAAGGPDRAVTAALNLPSCTSEGSTRSRRRVPATRPHDLFVRLEQPPGSPLGHHGAWRAHIAEAREADPSGARDRLQGIR